MLSARCQAASKPETPPAARYAQALKELIECGHGLIA